VPRHSPGTSDNRCARIERAAVILAYSARRFVSVGDTS
jgi:hypothetical protein